MRISDIPADSLKVLRRGAAIPAHLLALDASRKLDARRQRAMTRYYLDAGAGGVAAGVPSTQLAIRDVGLYAPVLELAMRTAQDWEPIGGRRPLFMVAGLAGRTQQAVREAGIARGMGYHAGLLSLTAMKGASEDALIAHCGAVAEVMPVVGSCLRPADGGIQLSASFWQRFAAIPNVVAMASQDRYRALDVVRGVVAARAEQRVSLYTGNDDHIVLDLLTPLTFVRDGRPLTVRIRGGLLGHWSVWTERAVLLLEMIHAAIEDDSIASELLAMDAQVTDCNAALFDVAHDFHGCIAGCHEVLRRQGLLEGIWCLDPKAGLSPGQAEALTRVSSEYPHLVDDAFVAAHRERWLA